MKPWWQHITEKSKWRLIAESAWGLRSPGTEHFVQSDQPESFFERGRERQDVRSMISVSGTGTALNNRLDWRAADVREDLQRASSVTQTVSLRWLEWPSTPTQTNSLRYMDFHPGNGLTVAHAGLPSLPVPGTRVSNLFAASIIFQVIPYNGIFKRLLQHVLV